MTANAPAVRAACTAANKHSCGKDECEHVGGKWMHDRNQCASWSSDQWRTRTERELGRIAMAALVLIDAAV